MEKQTTDPRRRDWDVVICGGGLAGLTLARQLNLQMPELSVCLIDMLSRPLPEAAFKVGESTTEAGAYYLGETLGLKDYLSREHLYKLGFRFFFGDGAGPFQERAEFGLSEFPVVPSFNVDRGLLENDLRTMNTESGTLLLEGCVVDDIRLNDGDERHDVLIRSSEDDRVHEIRARWVIDAMGRRRFLQRKLNLLKPFGRRCSAAWFRIADRVDVSDLVPVEEEEWHNRVPKRNRYYSTNHLMGRGYWVWIIPLPSDSTSIGIVALEDLHPFPEFSTYEAAVQWLSRNEPVFASLLKDRAPMDFMCMRHYSYSSRQVFSSKRWACVGDAGVFSDPLYAPATDLIGISNSMTANMIKLDRSGKLAPATVAGYNWSIIALNEALTRNIQVGYALFGTPVVTAAKIIWDTAAGWALLAPQIYNAIFVDHERSARIRKAKAGYFLLAQSMHRLFVDWATRSSGRMTFNFIDFLKVPLLLDLRQRNLHTGKSAAELVDDHVFNMDRIEELAQAIFLLAIEDTSPEYLDQFRSPIWLNAWAIGLSPDKWRDSGLFQPTTAPRDLETVRRQIRNLFRLENR